MIRTFIALELSNDIINELARLQDELKEVGSDVKWSNPSNIHLTLKFLGEIEEEKVSQIKQILDDISNNEKPFDVTLSEVGAFPNLDFPRVIWVGLDGNTSVIGKIVNVLEDTLEKIGFSKGMRPFSAHLTLGRVKSGKNKLELKEKLSTLKVNPISTKIKSIILFKSKLTPTGPIYTSLHEAIFKDE